MSVRFSKYHGAGNDFILIDDRTLFFPVKNSALIQRLSHRKFGIGADGLILLQHSKCADFRMRYFNSDGNEVEMCGNGIRCLARFIEALGIAENIYHIETGSGVLRCRLQGELVSVGLGKVSLDHCALPLTIDGRTFSFYLLNTGVPHAVAFVPEVEGLDLQYLGKSVRFHPLFRTQGINVNFAAAAEDHQLFLRTYERGVEGETLSCGTGAAAAALAASEAYGWNKPIKVFTASQEMIEVSISRCSNGENDVDITGPATWVFDGQIIL